MEGAQELMVSLIVYVVLCINMAFWEGRLVGSVVLQRTANIRATVEQKKGGL